MPASEELIERIRKGLASRYAVERAVGRGGMATVLLAKDLAHGRSVAIKVLDHDVAGGFAPDRFLREIRLLATLQHPHILPLHDSGMIDGIPYYVMPFVAGESLRDMLNRDGALPVPLALRINAESAAALDYAHRQGIIHRDIKPENILLSDGHVLIADFGIARATAQSSEESLTQTSLVIGTPAYMSPEQASGETQLDGRSDVYSLACVLFEMLSGKSPFSGSTIGEVLASRFRNDAPRISSVRSGLPRAVDRAIAAALSLSPDDRPRTAGEFAAMLAGDAAVPRLRERWSRNYLVIGAIALAVLVAGALALQIVAKTRGSGITEASVAVLPFETAQAGDRYLAEGMSDEILSALSGIPGLRIAAMSSTVAAARTITDAGELARKLNVRTLVSGNVRRQGDSLRVIAQLTDARGGFLIKSFRVDKRADDIFGAQDEIARIITSALAVRNGASRSPVKRSTRDVTAYDLYLQGRYLNRRQDTLSWNKAIRLYMAALARDSLYAAPWAGIADIYASRGMGNQVALRPRPEFERSRIAAQHALAIDSTSAEALAAMSVVQMMYDYDWRGSQKSLDKAHDADPGYERTYLIRSFLLSWLGKHDEATASTREALRMDPSMPIFRREIGRTLLLAGRAVEAERAERDLLATDSTNARARMILGQSLVVQGRAAEAVRELERSQRDLPTTRGAAFLAGALVAAGRRSDGQRIAESLIRESTRAFIPAMDIAIAVAGLQDSASTLMWLERAYDDRTLRPFIRDQVFDFVRTTPRYRAILARIKLPEVGK